MILKDGKFWDDKGNVVPIEHGNKKQIALMIEAMNKPKEIDAPDYTLLKQACKDYIDNSYIEKQYIFEAAMEAVYGKKIWDYLNSKP